MKKSLLIPLGLMTILCAAVSPAVYAADAAPLPVVAPLPIIFDTDMNGDCDDVGALFILHGAVERGEAKILATIGCSVSDAIAPCLDAINIWFGRPEIPVGTLKDPDVPAGRGYPDEVIKHFPHKFPSSKDYPEAVTLYRQILAKQPDGSVMILSVGGLRNLADLLKSRPDAASPLDGPALITKKVKRLDVMGGNYPPFAKANEGEANFKADTAATALVCANWPTPILFNGEGGSTCTGRRVAYEMPEHNPLTMAYKLYPGVAYAGDRLSWDPVSTLVMVRGAAPWYTVVSGGINVADAATGINSWQAGEDRGHSYLVLDQKRPKSEVETALEDMMVAGKGRPTNLIFNTVYYSNSGMCLITGKGERDKKGVWFDKAASSWLQCQYADGRKYLVTSYAIDCREATRLPRTLELSGSNDGGANWTVLDSQQNAGFSAQTPRREFTVAKPAKWNIYRLNVTATDAQQGVQMSGFELNEAINCLPKVAVATVTLDHTTLTLPLDSRATLNATIAPRDTFEREVAWSSSDPNIAEVRRIGEQIAIVSARKPGKCTVTSTIDGVKKTCSVTVITTTLPTGWNYDEIGAPPIPGGVVVADGKFTLTGCGQAMNLWWERVSDQGVFASKAITGDVELSARLTSLAPNVGGPAYQWDYRPPTIAGLMIRESVTNARGRYFLVLLEASGKLRCRWRDKANEQEDGWNKDLGNVTLPISLKIVQKGTEFQLFTSTDGQHWGEPLITHSSTFVEKGRIGMFVCSGNTAVTTTAIFDTVNITP